MSDLRTAAQQALEAIDRALPYAPHRSEFDVVADTADDLRAALAEPVQEPVAWMVYTLDGKSVCVTDNPTDFGSKHKALPLYTAPPQRKPLSVTDLQEALVYANLIDRDAIDDPDNYDEGSTLAQIDVLHRAIKLAHGIGGNDE